MFPQSPGSSGVFEKIAAIEIFTPPTTIALVRMSVVLLEFNKICFPAKLETEFPMIIDAETNME